MIEVRGRSFLLEDPVWAARRARRRRWAKRIGIGSLVAAVIALAGLAVARASASERRLENAMRADLERLARMEARYHAENGRFASLDDLGMTFVPSQGIRLWLDSSGGNRWSATAAHVRTARVCTATFSTPQPTRSPAPGDGELVIEC